MSEHTDECINPEMQSEMLSSILTEITQDTKNPCLYSVNEVSFERDLEKEDLVLIIGTAGSGKDTVMEKVMERGDCQHVKTATSRGRRYSTKNKYCKWRLKSIMKTASCRKDHEELLSAYMEKGWITSFEDMNKYVWMEFNIKNLDEKEFRKECAERYDLVEHDPHYGAIYGLPRKSLEELVFSQGQPIIRTEANGAEMIRRNLAEKYNILVIALVPDNIEQARDAIRNRDSSLSEEEIEKRLDEDIVMLKKSPEVANFFIHNTRQNVCGLTGLENSIRLAMNIITECLDQ